MFEAPIDRDPTDRIEPKKKPHQLSLAGLRVTPVRGYFSAAIFSFSLAITVSATLAGQPA